MSGSGGPGVAVIGADGPNPRVFAHRYDSVFVSVKAFPVVTSVYMDEHRVAWRDVIEEVCSPITVRA